MVTYYNNKDLVSLGNYLLSKEREDSLRQSEIENPNIAPYEDRFIQVTHADISNWKRLIKKGK